MDSDSKDDEGPGSSLGRVQAACTSEEMSKALEDLALDISTSSITIAKSDVVVAAKAWRQRDTNASLCKKGSCVGCRSFPVYAAAPGQSLRVRSTPARSVHSYCTPHLHGHSSLTACALRISPSLRRSSRYSYARTHTHTCREQVARAQVRRRTRRVRREEPRREGAALSHGTGRANVAHAKHGDGRDVYLQVTRRR